MLLSVSILSAALVFSTGETEVVMAPEAKGVVRFAAGEATNLLSRILGGPVPLVTAPTGTRKPIFLGDGPWTKEAGIDVAALPRDAFAVRPARGGLSIAGRDAQTDEAFPVDWNKQTRHDKWMPYGEHATVFGLYAFLERYAGARFYFPGDLGTVLPRRTEIRVEDGGFESAPDFTVRHFGYSDGKIPAVVLKSFGGDATQFRRVNALRCRLETRSTPCCHGLNKFRYLDRFGKTHPEYFAIDKAGRRNVSGSGHIGHLCYSSPIAEIIYQDVKAYLTGQPASSRGLQAWGANTSGDIVDVMSQDGMFPCECPDCQKRYNFDVGRYYASEFIWSNTVAMAKRLTAEGVKGRLAQMAYATYRGVPRTVEIPDNVLVMVAEAGPWTMSVPALKAVQIDELRAWTEKLGRKVWTWNYVNKATCTNLNLPGVPCSTPRAIGAWYREIAPLVFGAFLETTNMDRWLYNHLNYYVFARFAWDNDLDVDGILSEYYSLMFGLAAEEMRQFFELVEDKWIKDVAGGYRETRHGPKAQPPADAELYGRVYSPEVLAGCDRLFDAALAKVPAKSVEARRLRLMRTEFLEPLKANAAEYFAREERLKTFVVKAGADMEPLTLSRLPDRKAKVQGETLPTKVRVWSEKGLLRIVYDCNEPKMSCRVVGRGEDEDSVIGDDGIEIHLNPRGDRKSCYCFFVNSEGKTADAAYIQHGASISVSKNFDWKSGVTASVTKRADGWTADVTIPMSSMKGWSAAKGMIPMNFCRNRCVATTGKKTVDWYAWGAFVKGYADVQNFGTVNINQ